MQEYFAAIAQSQLTPNQTYLLYSIRSQTTPEQINIHQELRSLTPVWLNPTTSTLTAKSVLFLNQIDTLSGKKAVKISHKADTPLQKMGEGYLDKITEYRELFPPGMLPSGVSSRKPIPELEKKFFKFFTIFPDYSWDNIISATKKYVEHYAAEDYKYMKNSAYFISKEDASGAASYELASQIDMLDQDDLPQTSYYAVRTV